jgi:hypothetical protein
MPNFWVCSTLIDKNPLPMVVMILPKYSFVIYAPLFIKNIIGCASSAPDGSSPRGYSQKKNLILSIGSKTLCLLSFYQIVDTVGCALSAPDGSSPRGYSRIFSSIDSKNEFFFVDLSVPFTSIFRRLPWSSSILRHVTSDIFLTVFPTSVPHYHNLYFPLLELS